MNEPNCFLEHKTGNKPSEAVGELRFELLLSFISKANTLFLGVLTGVNTGGAASADGMFKFSRGVHLSASRARWF